MKNIKFIIGAVQITIIDSNDISGVPTSLGQNTAALSQNHVKDSVFVKSIFFAILFYGKAILFYS